jgi:SagB-type dehydrogenase family enzyme
MQPKGYDREFLKSKRWDEWETLDTDQRRDVPMPPPQKPPPEGAELVDLVAPEDLAVGAMPLLEAIRRRKSHRRYTTEPLTLEELSFLLWATQGAREIVRQQGRTYVMRTVPSAGARHPFETYLLANRVTDLEPGLYRYLPVDHKLCALGAEADLVGSMHSACFEQYVGDSAVTFVWTAIPYRTEWRYVILSPKLIALDAGHVCQNLYLAATAIGAGACAIGAYNQAAMDAVLALDGEDEFVIYMATVGKVK